VAESLGYKVNWEPGAAFTNAQAAGWGHKQQAGGHKEQDWHVRLGFSLIFIVLINPGVFLLRGFF
jgi:hypothetical protein